MTTRRTMLRAGAASALALAAGTAVPTAASAAPPPTADRRALRQALDRIVAAGASGALAELRDAAGVWRATSGVSQLGSPRPVPAQGRFRAGSVTKTFVATVVLQLAGEGRLCLDDPMERWLPGAIANSDRITVRHLLQHTSGTYNYVNKVFELFPTVPDILRLRHLTWSPQELLELVAGESPLFEPGTSWSYSNTNYILLGLIVERVTGCRYGTEVARRILGPLGLRHTTVPGTNPFIIGPHAHGYLPLVRDGQVEPVDITTFNPSVAWAAGEIVTTARDLNRFFGALLGGRLLRPAQLTQMLANPTGPDQYGLGIHRAQLPSGKELWGHGGSIFGYETYAVATEGGDNRLALSVNPWGGEPYEAMDDFVLTAFGESSPAARLTAPTWRFRRLDQRPSPPNPGGQG